MSSTRNEAPLNWLFAGFARTLAEGRKKAAELRLGGSKVAIRPSKGFIDGEPFEARLYTDRPVA